MQTFTAFLKTIPPAGVAMARLANSGISLLLIFAPWLPLLNITRSGVELILYIGKWFSDGFPYSVIFAGIAFFVVTGLGAGSGILVKAAVCSVSEGRVSRLLLLSMAIVLLLVFWMLSNRLMRVLLVLLSPLAVIVYTALSTLSLVPFLGLHRRWLAALLIFAGLCMWSGLIWLETGGGGMATSGFGYWLSWFVLFLGAIIEMFDAWIEKV